MSPSKTKRDTASRNSRTHSIERALAKSHVFGLLARALRYPDKQLFAALQSGRWATDLSDAVRLSGSKPQKTFRITLQNIAESLPDRLEALQGQHSALYSSGNICPLQESDYVASHAFQKTDVMADVAGFYRAFGLRVSRAQRELPDFLGSELEFLHTVAWKQAQAMQEGCRDGAAVCRQAHRKFLAAHLTMWVEAFRAKMETSPAGRFYVVLACLVEAFVKAEGVRPQFVLPAPPESTLPESAGCVGCEALEQGGGR